LRGTSKAEKVGDFETVQDADDMIEANQNPICGWIYFRELTDGERKELEQ
jgi:hypothetical protein